MSVDYVKGETVTHWVCGKMAAAGYPLTLADIGPCESIGVVKDGKPIFACVFNWFRPHPRHENANDINVIIAKEPGARFSKNEVLPYLFKYAYDELKCGRITAIIAEGNDASIKLVKRLGFRKEGTIRRGYDGKKNAIVFGQLKNECKFVGDNRHG